MEDFQKVIDDLMKDLFPEEEKEDDGTYEVGIEKVYYNNPATIVFWNDGTKTVVRCGEGDIFDKEKGLAMAIAKKAFGNSGSYYEIFKDFCKEEKEEEIETPKIEIKESEIETPKVEVKKEAEKIKPKKLGLFAGLF